MPRDNQSRPKRSASVSCPPPAETPTSPISASEPVAGTEPAERDWAAEYQEYVRNQQYKPIPFDLWRRLMLIPQSAFDAAEKMNEVYIYSRY